MHMHNQISHTTFFVWFFSMFARFVCDVFAWRFFVCIFCTLFLLVFCRVFRFFCVFSRKHTKDQKKSQTKSKYKANKCKGKDQNVFDRICFACWLHVSCLFCAFLLHVLCLFGALLLHLLCIVFCICLVDKCGLFFRILFAVFCIPRHPLATCFCVFCAVFSGLVLHLLHCVCMFFVLLCHQN